MQRQLDHNRYEPIWLMMHKIQAAMENRDAHYYLEGIIEFDEGYFTKGIRKGSRVKPSRSSQKKQNVAVIAESIPLEDIETSKQIKQCRYFKMQVLNDHKAKNIDEVVKENIDEKTIVLVIKVQVM